MKERRGETQIEWDEVREGMDDEGSEGGVEAEGKWQRQGESREIRVGNPGRSKSWAFKIWVNTPKPLFCPCVSASCMFQCVNLGRNMGTRRNIWDSHLHLRTSAKTSCPTSKIFLLSVSPSSSLWLNLSISSSSPLLVLRPDHPSLTQACSRNAISCFFGEENWPTFSNWLEKKSLAEKVWRTVDKKTAPAWPESKKKNAKSSLSRIYYSFLWPQPFYLHNV